MWPVTLYVRHITYVELNPSPHLKCFVSIHDALICLCSGSHHRKQELVKELQRNGVTFDVRKLNVGDFLWVAREKVTPVPGNTNTKTHRTLHIQHVCKHIPVYMKQRFVVRFFDILFYIYRLKRLIVKTISINRYLQPYWKLCSTFSFFSFLFPGW